MLCNVKCSYQNVGGVFLLEICLCDSKVTNFSLDLKIKQVRIDGSGFQLLFLVRKYTHSLNQIYKR